MPPRRFEKQYNHKPELSANSGYFCPEDHQLVRPVVIVRGKKKADMESLDDYNEIIEVAPSEPLMQKPDAFGCQIGAYT